MFLDRRLKMLDYAKFYEQLPDNGIPVSVICFEGKIEAEISQEAELMDLPSYPEVRKGVDRLNEIDNCYSIKNFQAYLLQHLGVVTA
jgi:hypothetical protein